MRRTQRLIALTIAALSAHAAVAMAEPPTSPDTNLSCTFRHPITEVGDIGELPPSILNAMLARMDPLAREDAKFEWHHLMAPRGGAYSSTDVIVGDAPSRRFIRAGHEGTEWFVWYEHGGVAASKNIALFHERLGHGVPIVRAFISYAQQDPCALTDDLMDNKIPTDARAPASW
jgi:hypothetical protein